MITQQISIFDIFAEMGKKPSVAVSMMNNQEYELREVEPWMSKLVPNGEYCFSLDGMYTMVLRAARAKVTDEMKFCHYRIGDKIYSAVGVGIEINADEYEEDDINFNEE